MIARINGTEGRGSKRAKEDKLSAYLVAASAIGPILESGWPALFGAFEGAPGADRGEGLAEEVGGGVEGLDGAGGLDYGAGRKMATAFTGERISR